MLVTRADNVCYAEMYADTQHFKAAVYDQSLSQEEQASLARGDAYPLAVDAHSALGSRQCPLL